MDEHRLFRCVPLAATLSLRQCRINRVRAGADDFRRAQHQPLATEKHAPCSFCRGCPIAARAEAGIEPSWAPEELLAGRIPPRPASPIQGLFLAQPRGAA